MKNCNRAAEWAALAGPVGRAEPTNRADRARPAEPSALAGLAELKEPAGRAERVRLAVRAKRSGRETALTVPAEPAEPAGQRDRAERAGRANPTAPANRANRADRTLWRFRRARNRLTVCPECGGKLSFDRDAVTSERGFIYRARPCLGCGALVHTKQGPEEICGAESCD